MTIKNIEKVALECGQQYKVREDYSGRGMFGKKCVGIVGPNLNLMIEKASEFGDHRGMRTDDMGKSYIVYWPEVVS